MTLTALDRQVDLSVSTANGIADRLEAKKLGFPATRDRGWTQGVCGVAYGFMGIWTRERHCARVVAGLSLG